VVVPVFTPERRWPETWAILRTHDTSKTLTLSVGASINKLALLEPTRLDALTNRDPGQGGGSRVYPGKKMAGNMGNTQNTVQNLKILKVKLTP
jgi:hypothetical protein